MRSSLNAPPTDPRLNLTKDTQIKFDDFLLDRWLQEKTGPSIRHNFGGSTGPQWSVREVLALDGEDVVDRLLDLKLLYSKTLGTDALRGALGEMANVPADHVAVLIGAAESLRHVFFLAAEPGANIVLPFPCYSTQEAVPKAFGMEIRHYGLRREKNWRADVDEVASLIDDKRKVLLVNVPHNPTGASLTDEELDWLHDLAIDRGVQFVCDKVHRPVFHGQKTASTARLPHATTIGDVSKAFSLPGLRLGWIIEPDAERRAHYFNSREYVSICNSPLTEFVAEVAVRHRGTIFDKASAVAAKNLSALDEVFTRNADIVGWVKPVGGMTGFPWLKQGPHARAFCTAAAENGFYSSPATA